MGQADTAADQFTYGARNRDLVSTRTTVILSPSLIHSVHYFETHRLINKVHPLFGIIVPDTMYRMNILANHT